MRADGLQVDDLIRKLKDAKMDLTGPDTDAKAAAGEKVGTASVTDNTGTQTLDIYKAKDAAKDKSYYAKSSVVAGVYKVAGDLGDSLGKSVEDFRNKKLFDFGFNESRNSISTELPTRSRRINGCQARPNSTPARSRP